MANLKPVNQDAPGVKTINRTIDSVMAEIHLVDRSIIKHAEKMSAFTLQRQELIDEMTDIIRNG